MLAAINIPYVIIGHSERRQFNFEDNQLLKGKVRAALDAGLKVIFVVVKILKLGKQTNIFSMLKYNWKNLFFS